MSFLLVIAGLLLSALSLTIHVGLSNKIGWNYGNNFEAYVTGMVFLVGMSLLLVGCVLAVVSNHHLCSPQSPQKLVEA